RAESVRGYVQLLLSIDDLAADTFTGSGWTRGVASMRDVTDGSVATALWHWGSADNSPEWCMDEFIFAGRDWQIGFHPEPGFEEQASSGLAPLLAGICMLLSLLLATYLHGLQHRTHEIEDLVDRRTAGLMAAQQALLNEKQR